MAKNDGIMGNMAGKNFHIEIKYRMNEKKYEDGFFETFSYDAPNVIDKDGAEYYARAELGKILALDKCTLDDLTVESITFTPFYGDDAELFRQR